MDMKENKVGTLNGWMLIGVLTVTGVGVGYWIFTLIRRLVETQEINGGGVFTFVLAGLLLLLWFVCCFGFFTLEPNRAQVLILFGKYKGTVKESGFWWANPLLSKQKVSLRAHNLNGSIIKVNDLRGNPIEIAVVVVWRVTDTAKAVFDVEDYEDYVSVQSESALRHLASAYPYDTTRDNELSLRGSMDEVSAKLEKELQERIEKAGVHVGEARISHLAYASEIAGAMLQRQQAEAVVAARTRIVDGAVGMVEMALQRLKDKGTIDLDEERKAAMVSNLLVVLCGDKAAHPVINAGTLYT